MNEISAGHSSSDSKTQPMKQSKKRAKMNAYSGSCVRRKQTQLRYHA